MKLVAVTSWILSLLILYSGILGFQAGSLASLISSLIFAAVMAASGGYSWKGKKSAGYFCGVMTFLLAVYFAYRFIASESFIPAGLLLIVSFFGLFFVLLGVFLGLKEDSASKFPSS
jgi:uncharacterized membrane protein (UPF0136 family)